ncbi:GEVED domain-containing protein [Aequorivita marina]|uniref:GEVED domain-containing protein n=1 Tax=Aequorivita marina TaxID=3073654 RepID=UPI0028763251|nr:GEVED domain-containing protein [Aequorivita sp. S2608]MDS1297839.1 GEVED domain-containing protein [Aequorivita sp. S2608]
MKNKLPKKGTVLFTFMMFLAMSFSMNAQYCVPEATNSERFIDNFSTTLGSDNISNLESGFSADGYGDFSDTQGVTQARNQSVDFSVDIEGGSAGFRIWVDWNQDEVFDTSEEVAFNSSGYSATHDGSIEVPGDALEGDTRMRIVSHWLSSAGDVDPCVTDFTYGEFEDYKFTVVAGQDCTGTPEAGTAILDLASGNPGSTYVVSAEDYTVADALSFQWQSNTNGAGWEDQGDATAAHTPYTATAPSEIGDEAAWRLALTCTASGETAFSEVATFTTEISYCEITVNSTEPISKVVFAGIDNDSSPLTTSEGYEDFTAIVAEVEAGETYSFTAEGNTNGSYINFFTVWIDWNQNGTFDTEEMYEIGSIEDSDGTDGQQAVNDIEVPADALEGETRMRIVKNYNTSRTNPCGLVSYGQVEDYTVNLGGSGGGTFPAPYCEIADADEVMVEEITAVDFAGTSITNNDNTSPLIDKTDVVVAITAGDTYTISVEGNTYGDFDSNIVAFIDWNQNETLDDAGEVYEIGTLSNSSGDDGVSVSMDIDVPADAVLGETRVRVTKTYFDADSPAEINPCGIEFSPGGYGIFPGFGQSLDFTVAVEEGNSIDCDQGDDSNEFENGLNITAGGTYRNADDFMVTADNTLNVKSIELNVIASDRPDNYNINFYNDDNGVPGSTVVHSVTAVEPYAQVAVGTAFGFNVYAVFIEVDLDFDGGASGTTYWMQPEATIVDGAFWEVSTVGTLGEPMHSSEDQGAWTPDEDGSQGVFKLHCDVATPPDQECFFDITSSVEPITRLIMANVDNASPVSSSEALEDFTSVVINAEAGESYDVALEGDTAGSFTNYFTIFVNTDLDNEWTTYETFEIGSITGSTGDDGQQATANITLPTSLTEGEYLLRVVKNFNASPLDPCAAYSFGQGEDYTLNIGPVDDCTGTPDAGAATVSPEEGNPNSDYTVSAAGYGSANGITYQWQSNTDGAGWENEGDLLDQYANFDATAPADAGAEVEWRLEVTCTFSQEAAFSETATFTTTSSSIYCIPVLDCTDGDVINNVLFQEIDNATACSPDGYGDYTAMVATVQSNGTYPISVTVGGGWANESVSVWIDFDDNGTFDEDEFFFIGTGSAETLTGDIAIPNDVADGNYRMRVRVAAVDETTATWDMACDEDQVYGETEDYTVTVDGVAGVDDNATNSFTFYPNPVENTLTISANETIQSVSAYNVLGQEVLNNTNFADGKMDVSSLPTGTFMFRLTFESGQAENFKVVKK